MRCCLPFAITRARAQPVYVTTSLGSVFQDMALEFGEMLKETLDKMGAQIELSSSSWEADSGAGVARRLEDFKLGVSTDI